jgi:anti-sigma-K factor RskA
MRSIIAAGVLIQLAYLLVLAALETSESVAPSRDSVRRRARRRASGGLRFWRVGLLLIVAGVVVLAVALQTSRQLVCQNGP